MYLRWYLSSYKMNRAEYFGQIGKYTGKPSLSARVQRNICACFRCSCPCKWMFLFIRAAAFSRDPLCPNIPLRQLSLDLSDLAMLFSVCFSNTLAPTKMNLLVWRGIIDHLKNQIQSFTQISLQIVQPVALLPFAGTGRKFVKEMHHWTQILYSSVKSWVP